MTPSRTLFTLIGSFGLLLAFASAIALFGIGLSTRPDRDGGKTMATMMVTAGLAAGLLPAYACALGNGGFGWLLQGRIGTPMRWTLVLAAVLSAIAVAGLAALMRGESPGQSPWVLRPVRHWAHWVWLPGLLAGAVLGLFPSLREGLSPRSWQLPLQALAVVSLVMCAGLLVELSQSMARQQAVREQSEQDFHDRRDASILQQVQQADPERDFVSLLSQTSRGERPHIRELALAKVRSHPDLNGALAQVLRGNVPDQAFTFLASNDPPDARALAEAVREGIENHARDLHDSISRTHTLRPDDYQYPVFRILEVAERYAPYGVDYRPALKQLRDAFDAPRDYAQPTPKMNGQRAIDDWLRKH